MTGMNARKWSVSLVLMTLVISCAENEDVGDVSPYLWKESHISPVNSLFHSAQFELGDDGSLYAWGSSTFSGQRGIFKYDGTTWYAGSTWVNIVEPNNGVLDYLLGVTIFQGSAYFHAFDRLYKFENGLTTEILRGNFISDVVVYNNQLIISGEEIEISNDTFSIVAFDGNTFQPISKELALSSIVSANNKVYIPGNPGFVYDGQQLNSLNHYGYFFAVDGEESVYFGDSFDENFKMEKRQSSGQTETVGNIISDFGTAQKVEFYNGTLIVIGEHEENGFSSTHFLDGQEWVKIPTEHYIYDVVVFDNRFLSISLDGRIFELIKK